MKNAAANQESRPLSKIGELAEDGEAENGDDTPAKPTEEEGELNVNQELTSD